MHAISSYHDNSPTNNARPLQTRRAKLQGWKMQDWKMREQIAGVENAGVSRMERQPEVIKSNLFIRALLAHRT